MSPPSSGDDIRLSTVQALEGPRKQAPDTQNSRYCCKKQLGAKNRCGVRNTNIYVLEEHTSRFPPPCLCACQPSAWRPLLLSAEHLPHPQPARSQNISVCLWSLLASLVLPPPRPLPPPHTQTHAHRRCTSSEGWTCLTWPPRKVSACASQENAPPRQLN